MYPSNIYLPHISEVMALYLKVKEHFNFLDVRNLLPMRYTKPKINILDPMLKEKKKNVK